MNYPEYVDNIISALEENGESAYIVGGSVRDMLIGKKPFDYDVTTSSLPERTAKIFSHMRVIETGIKHGTLTVISDSHPIEITTFRIDGSYSDMRHPDAVHFTDDICADLSRRDFTVNAIAYNKRAGLVDIFGGREDIERKLIRAVGDAKLRFSEDALRIMRAFRFSAQLGFDIENDTLRACGEMADGLIRVARERIGAEFLKLVTSPYPSPAISKMKELSVLPFVLGDYVPTDTCINSLPDMPNEDIARLGLLLSGADRDTAHKILTELRLSSKQLRGALAVCTGSHVCVATAQDARRLFTLTGVYAPLAARASELLGISPKGAYDLVLREGNAPHKVSDLKICGKNISALGASGKQIGKVLEALLFCVLENPGLNEHDTLIALAEQIIQEGSITDGNK